MLTLRLLTLIHLVLLPLPPFAESAGQTATQGAQVTSHVTVTLPQADAELTVEGKMLEGTGTARTFDTAALPRGSRHSYTFSVLWKPNTYTTMTRTRIVSFRAGEALSVDLTREDPTDRVRVMYVPTPEDVAQAMVKLARVTSNDVVFEPGCGDARITIAAVKAGARRGVGIDIDPERVAESRQNVKAAGLSDRIEIREGDALEIPDLSNASVVFLYMGDHFNMLIRPNLWKQLKVGSRVVSHRFRMGDWEPDETITVMSDEFGEYELHLWTITEEVKRKLGAR